MCNVKNNETKLCILFFCSTISFKFSFFILQGTAVVDLQSEPALGQDKLTEQLNALSITGYNASLLLFYFLLVKSSYSKESF